MAATQQLLTTSVPSLTASDVRKIGYEARSFIHLVKSGRATVEQVREQIGTNTPYRRNVLLSFDALRNDITPELRATVVRLLRNHSCSTMHAKLGISLNVLRRISKQTSFLKVGRGRRLTSELKNQILDSVKSGKRSTAIQRELGVCISTIQQCRRALGDYENRKFWRKLSPTEIAHGVDLLKEGKCWREVARILNCGLSTALKSIRFRKGHVRVLSQVERDAIIEALRSGLSQENIAKRFHRHNRVIRRLQVEAGLPPRSYRKFTAAEISKIRELMAAGRTNAGIARDLKCTQTAIWQHRFRMAAKRN